MITVGEQLARKCMWDRLFIQYPPYDYPGDLSIRKNKKKALLKNLGYTKAWELQPLEEDYKMSMNITGVQTGWLEVTPSVIALSLLERLSKPKENTMSYDFDDDDCPTFNNTFKSEVDKQRDYLMERLEEIRYNKVNALEKTYHLLQDDAPKTPKELAARLAAGLYIVRDADKDYDTSMYFGSIKSYIEWRDPATPADPKGYEAAIEAMNLKVLAIRDAINIAAPADALKMLQDFEAAE